jgi:hypothetical protein
VTAKQREILHAIARVEPRGSSVELLPEDRAAIREQFALALAPALGMDEETVLAQIDAARMIP